MNTIGLNLACQIVNVELGVDSIAVHHTMNQGAVFFPRGSSSHLFHIDEAITEKKVRDACTVYLVKRRLMA